MDPLVSVIMPAYNAERWIAEAIDSILNQTYENIELLIFDDGSTDKTAEIMYKYSKENLGHISPISATVNVGITRALNHLIKYSKGKYIARMDADDIAMPDRIEKQVKYLEQYLMSVQAVGSAIQMFWDKNTNAYREKWWGNSVLSPAKIGLKLPYRNPICHPSVMFRAEILKKYMYEGGAFQDYDLFLRMASDGLWIGKTDETLLKYRIRNDSEAAMNESDWAEIKLKLRFLAKKFPHWNKFDTHVMRSIWQIIRR